MQVVLDTVYDPQFSVLQPIPVELGATPTGFRASAPALGLLLESEGSSEVEALRELAAGLIEQYNIFEKLGAEERPPFHDDLARLLKGFITR